MTEVLVALIVAGSTLTGVFITQRHESKKRKSEERRWYADYFLRRQEDALNKLYAALENGYLTHNQYGNYAPSTLREFKEEVEPKVDKYLGYLVMSSIYLDDQEMKTMKKALGAFRQASMAIWLKSPDCPASKDGYSNATRELDWDRLSETHDKAVLCLRDRLNPKVIQDLLEGTFK